LLKYYDLSFLEIFYCTFFAVIGALVAQLLRRWTLTWVWFLLLTGWSSVHSCYTALESPMLHVGTYESSVGGIHDIKGCF